jgi:hypothetical protein
MRHAARACAGSRIYVHDVKGFLWSIGLAVWLIDAPMALHFSTRQCDFSDLFKTHNAIAAALLQIVAIPCFLLLRARFGPALKVDSVTVPIGQMEAVELCLASLGELKNSRVTSLDETDGEICATTVADGVRRNVMFSIFELDERLSEIRVRCQPAEAGVTMDLFATNHEIVHKLTSFISSFPDWEHQYECSVRYFNENGARRARPGIGWGFAFSVLLVILTMAQQWKANQSPAPAISAHYFRHPARRGSTGNINIDIARADIAIADNLLSSGYVDRAAPLIADSIDFEKAALNDMHKARAAARQNHVGYLQPIARNQHARRRGRHNYAATSSSYRATQYLMETTFR